MTEPTDIELNLAWLIDNSEGVVGLTLDGSVLPWERVLALYLPQLSADFIDHEIEREAGA